MDQILKTTLVALLKDEKALKTATGQAKTELQKKVDEVVVKLLNILAGSQGALSSGCQKQLANYSKARIALKTAEPSALIGPIQKEARLYSEKAAGLFALLDPK